MHARNPYSLLPPDFAALAVSAVGEELRPFIFQSTTQSATIDFKRPEAVRALTRTLLLHDFKLDIHIPDDRLCPTVANRLDYLLWIQDILLASSPSSTDSNVPLRPIHGLDIGTGSTAIYPLLGVRHFPGWEFWATEIDPDSHHHAQANISRNWASEKIKLYKTTQSDPIFLPFHLEPDALIDFTMCNPPFYASEAEIAELAAGKKFTPHAICTGAETEMITAGGEVAFVKRMIEESVALRERCRWFTSLLGKASSVSSIVLFLREKKITNYALSESLQGHTKRWAVAWSLGHSFLPDALARPTNPSFPTSLLPPSTLYTHHFPSPFTPAFLAPHLLATLSSLAGSTTTPLTDPSKVKFEATWHSWSRAARRGKTVAPPPPGEDSGPFLMVEFELLLDEAGEKRQGGGKMEMRVIEGRGKDEAVGLGMMVGRKISDLAVAAASEAVAAEGDEGDDAMDL